MRILLAPLAVATLVLVSSPASAQCPGAPPTEVSAPGSAQPLVFSGATTLLWESGAASCSDSFELYRGDLDSFRLGDHAQCRERGIAVSTTVDADEPFSGTGWFYLVAGINAQGRGPWGLDTSGDPFDPPGTCSNGIELCDNANDDDGDGLADCMDRDCAADVGCAVPICECIGPCDPATPDVVPRGADLRQIVRDWSATLAVEASDPGGNPLSYAWSTDCPGALAPAGPTASLLAVPVGVATDCRVDVEVSNGAFGRRCSLPLRVDTGRAIDQSLVHVIGPDDPLRVLGSAEEGMTFLMLDDAPPTLVPGDYVVVNQPGGGIRQVVAAWVEPPDVLVLEGPAVPITEIVLQTLTEGTYDLSAVASSYPGDEPVSGDASDTQNLPGCRPSFNGVEVNTENGVEVGATLDGFSFSPTLNVKVDVDWGRLKELKAEIGGSLMMRATAGVTVGAGVSAETSFDLVACTNYFTLMVGPVPVLIKTVLALEAGAGASVTAEAGVSQRYDFTGTATMGVRYRNGSLSPIGGHTESFVAHNPAMSIVGNASAEVTLGPRAEVLFYAVAGPVMRAQAFLGFDATLNVVPPATFSWSVPAGFRATAGGKLDLFAIEEEIDFTLFERQLGILAGGGAEPTDTTYSISIVNPPATGRIYSANGLDCPPDCSETLPNGTVIELIPVPTPGWRFDGFTRYSDCANLRARIGPDITCEAHWSPVRSLPPNASLWLHEIPGTSAGSRIDWSRGGSTLVRTAGANLVFLDGATGTLLETAAAGSLPATTVEYSPFGEHLASADDARARRVGERSSQCAIGSAETVNHCRAVRETYELRLPWGLRPSSQSYVNGVTWSPWGEWFASGSDDGRLYVWTEGGAYCDHLLIQPQGSTYPITDLAWSPDGRKVLLAMQGFKWAHWVDKVDNFPLACLINLIIPGSRQIFQAPVALGYVTPCTTQLNAVAWSPDQRLMAFGCENGKIGLLQVGSRSVAGMTLPGGNVELTGHAGAVTAIDWHPDGTMFASVDDASELRVWSWDGTPLTAVGQFVGELSDVAWSPDGKYLALAGTTNSIVYVQEAVPPPAP